ncbi:MAG: DNA polymerase III subunit alpha [Deltaproteobacteria bacterium]|nr:DNA polymerase III subunit alpha [Deltaproteobacteria bacterium]
MSQGFVHLHLHSQYSLLDGAIKFEDLFPQAKEFGMEAVALTDHGNLFGAYDFFKKAKETGIKPIIGCEIYVTPKINPDNPSEGKTHHLTVLSMNQKGYQNLSRLVTKAYFDGFYRKPRIDHELLDKHNEGLIVLSGCLNSELSQAIFSKDMNAALDVAAMYREIFGDRYYLEVQATGLPEQKRVNKKVKEVGERLGIPLVATNDCHFLRREDTKPHDALLCIQTGSSISDENRFRFQGDQYYLKSEGEMLGDLPGFEDAIARTGEIAKRCNFEFEQTGYLLPEFEVEGDKSLDEYMSELSREKLRGRINEGLIPEEKFQQDSERLETELKIILEMGFSGYFLVVADFISYAKSNGIPVGPGRGSAAGSLVAYALGITEVDPIPYNLIFERFLNPERISMPDIDIDFCGEGRDEVIRYVTEKYGADKVAQIGTFGTMSAKAVVKDVGRVLGIPYADVDKVSKLIPSFRGKVFSIDRAIKEVKEIKDLIKGSPQLQEMIELAKPLENMVRHSSTHAAGIVIANEPLADHIPLYKGSKNEVVTQFDMNSIEELGFVKFDFLGLKTLTVINKALKLIRENYDSDKWVRIGRIPLDDKRVYELLMTGRTRGIFQIESSGMRDVLNKLQPTQFEDLIALLALYRPGPLDSGMVDDFIKRKHGKQKIQFPLPELKEILNDTYGLFVYQEQIMQTASVVAEYSLGEADLLRRAMGKKKPEEMKAQRDRFLEGAKKKDIKDKKAKEIFNAMEKFAEYSFNKSHSTAYALITYQTAYLKAHFPAEFMAALLSVESGNTDKVISSITECKQMGIPVLAPDVNESMAEFTASNGKIRFGLSGIKNVGHSTVQAIIEAREGKGNFESIFNFCEQVEARKLNRRTFESLIKSGAFDSIGAHRACLMESVDTLLSFTSIKQKSSAEGQHSLFALNDSVTMPTLSDVDKWQEKEVLANEMEVLGFYVTSHPMAKYSSEMNNNITSMDTEGLLEIKEKCEVSIAGVVRSLIVKHTKSGSGIYGNLVLEDMKGSVEVVIFDKLLRKSLPILEEKVEPVIIKGIAEPNEDQIKLRALDIISLRGLRNGSVVHISFNKASSTRDNFEQLSRILDKYPGNCEVHVHINTDDGESVLEVGDFKVDVEDSLISEVEKLLGEGALRFV